MLRKSVFLFFPACGRHFCYGMPKFQVFQLSQPMKTRPAEPMKTQPLADFLFEFSAPRDPSIRRKKESKSIGSSGIQSNILIRLSKRVDTRWLPGGIYHMVCIMIYTVVWALRSKKFDKDKIRDLILVSVARSLLFPKKGFKNPS
jgi:nitrogen fixation-related uncharacterized protein